MRVLDKKQDDGDSDTGKKWNQCAKHHFEALARRYLEIPLSQQDQAHNKSRRQDEVINFSATQPSVQHIDQRSQEKEQCAAAEQAKPPPSLRTVLLVGVRTFALLEKGEKQQHTRDVVCPNHFDQDRCSTANTCEQ